MSKPSVREAAVLKAAKRLFDAFVESCLQPLPG